MNVYRDMMRNKKYDYAEDMIRLYDNVESHIRKCDEEYEPESLLG